MERRPSAAGVLGLHTLDQIRNGERRVKRQMCDRIQLVVVADRLLYYLLDSLGLQLDTLAAC